MLASTPIAFVLIGAGTWDNPSELHRLQPISILALALGCVWLATAAFGKENTFGTLESMLSLPITRRQIWRKKCVTTATTIGSTIALFMCSVWLAQILTQSNNGFLKPDEYALALIYILLCAIGPAFLFTTYQWRSHEAFWITTLTPFGFAIGVMMVTPASLGGYRSEIIAGILLVYGLVTLWFARSRMLHWEASSHANHNIVLKLPRFRADSSKRERGKHTAIRGTGRLILKEIRIHQFSFIVTIVLAILYIATISTLRGEETRHGVIENLLIDIRLFWLLIPAMIGATAIAEERGIGVTPWHSTLPISRLRQWTIKLSVALGLGFILGALLPWPIDHYLVTMMKENAVDLPVNSERTHFLMLTRWGFPILATVLGFYASSMARSLFQGIFIAAMLYIALMFQIGIASLSTHHFTPLDKVDSTALVYLVTALVTIPFLIYQSYRNYPLLRPFRSLIKPLVGGWILTTFLVTSISTAAFSRVWEPWVPLPSLVKRTATGDTLAQIIRDKWGITILSSSGRLYHLSRGSEKTTPLIQQYGPDRVWKTLAMTLNNRLAISQDGELWTWHASQDFPQHYPQIQGTTRIVESTVPWVKLVTRPQYAKNGNGQTYIYGLKSDGTLHRSKENARSLITQFEPVNHPNRFQTISTSEHYVVGITLEGQLALIGNDARQLLTSGILNQDSSEAGIDDNNKASIESDAPKPHGPQLTTLVTILDSSTDWKAIHIHQNAVRLSPAGNPLTLLEVEEMNVILGFHKNWSSSMRVFPSVIFEKNDGSYWTQGWTSRALNGVESDIGNTHKLVQLDENLWSRTVSINYSPPYVCRFITIKRDQSLWDISRTEWPALPISPAFQQYEKQLSKRTDWTAIQALEEEGTRLGVTANDILWIWGKPFEQTQLFRTASSTHKTPLIPYQSTPRPFYDLREGKLISQ